MSEVLVVHDADLVKSLRDATYDPLIFLNVLNGRAVSVNSKRAMFSIPEWLGAITAHSTMVDSDVEADVTPNMTIGNTEVFFIHHAFTSPVVVGIIFNISMIINTLKLIIDNYIGEDPEGTVYIWCPLNSGHEGNYEEFILALNDLANLRKRDIVLLIDKIFS